MNRYETISGMVSIELNTQSLITGGGNGHLKYQEGCTYQDIHLSSINFLKKVCQNLVWQTFDLPL